MERHAILIANDTFPKSGDTLGPLSTVIQDHDRMKRLLGKLRLPPFKVESVINRESRDIDDVLNTVMESMNPEVDLLLIYYAGHGRILNKAGRDSLLLSTFGSVSKPDDKWGADFPYSEIEQKITTYEIRRAIIILDCCYSGAVIDETESRGDHPAVAVPRPFNSPAYSLVPSHESDAEIPSSARDMGDGFYILTACAADQLAMGNTRTHGGEFTGHLLQAFEKARDCSTEPITVQTVFKSVFEAMKGTPQTPSLIKRNGKSPYLVIASQGIHGDSDKRSLRDWVPIPADRMSRLNCVLPMYFLDSGFRFLHWNVAFDDIIARQLGLVIGCHAMEFISRLANIGKITNRNPDVFPMPTQEETNNAEKTGEIWEGFPPVDVESLEFVSERFGLIVFDKLARQIREPKHRKSTTWQVELNVSFVQRNEEFWSNAKDLVKWEELWASYADSYDDVVQKYPGYQNLVKKIVAQVDGCKECLEIGAGTANTTLELLKTAGRNVVAIESNDAMLMRMVSKLDERKAYVKVLKGDATTVVRRIFREKDDERLPPEIFDACVMTNSLFALPDPAECLKAVFKVMKPGGILSLSTPRPDAPVEQLMTKIRDWQIQNNRDEWLESGEGAWPFVSKINQQLVELARLRKLDVAKLKQIVSDAQFKIVDAELSEGVYEDCVIVLKAVKPDLEAAKQPIFEVLPPQIEVPPVSALEPANSTKKKIKLFISYARANSKRVEELLHKLKVILGPSKRYEYEFWKDNENVLVGEDWDSEIKKAMHACHIGLLLVSKEFLVSEYINEQELTRFVGDQIKPIIPVLLDEVDFKRYDMKGIPYHQIYALDVSGERRAYEQCTTKSRKDAFVKDLFEQLEDRIEKIFQ